MNRQNFEASDRFPLSTQALSFMQEMVFATAQLALIGGDDYILSGCSVLGNTVSDGVIVIAGETMPFKGGTATATITIVEEMIPVSANGLTFGKARTRRHAMFATGTGANYLPWAGFKQLSTNKQLEEAKATVKYVDDAIAGIQAGSIPRGVIVMWGGAEAAIPNGWCLCDGRTLPDGNKVPDLRGRFIAGYNSTTGSGYDEIGKTGGADAVTLSIEQMPAHTHTVSKTADDHGPDHVDSFGVFATVLEDVTSKDIGIEKAGGDKPHENRPPFYVLAFIIKI